MLMEYINPYKDTLIMLMPYFALVIIILGYFLPIAIGTKALIGFIFGLIGRMLFPYYMKWKENSENLKFNYTYLYPILILIVTGVIAGLAGFEVYLTMLLGNEPSYVVYLGAIIFAYGGYDLFNGFRKWLAFLENIWQESQTLESENITPDVDKTIEAATVEEEEEFKYDLDFGEREPKDNL